MKLDCGHEPSEHAEFTTGYGTDKNGKKHCYACCAENDKQFMRDNKRIMLYYNHDKNHITNWPASLTIPVPYHAHGKHNIGRTRVDMWFMFEGKQWYGVHYGEFNEIVHCKELKYAM